jgi:hypothetical protein
VEYATSMFAERTVSYKGKIFIELTPAVVLSTVIVNGATISEKNVFIVKKIKTHNTSYELFTKMLQISNNFLLTSYELNKFTMYFLQTSHKRLANFIQVFNELLQTSCKLLTIFLQTSHKFLKNFLKISYELLKNILQMFYKHLEPFL